MHRRTDNSSTVNVTSRCQHRTGNGRCRMPVAEPSTSLCLEHSRTSTEAVASEMLGSIQQFDSLHGLCFSASPSLWRSRRSPHSPVSFSANAIC